eukprot:gene24459-19806_t
MKGLPTINCDRLIPPQRDLESQKKCVAQSAALVLGLEDIYFRFSSNVLINACFADADGRAKAIAYFKGQHVCTEEGHQGHYMSGAAGCAQCMLMKLLELLKSWHNCEELDEQICEEVAAEFLPLYKLLKEGAALKRSLYARFDMTKNVDECDFTKYNCEPMTQEEYAQGNVMMCECMCWGWAEGLCRAGAECKKGYHCAPPGIDKDFYVVWRNKPGARELPEVEEHKRLFSEDIEALTAQGKKLSLYRIPFKQCRSWTRYGNCPNPVCKTKGNLHCLEESMPDDYYNVLQEEAMAAKGEASVAKEWWCSVCFTGNWREREKCRQCDGVKAEVETRRGRPNAKGRGKGGKGDAKEGVGKGKGGGDNKGVGKGKAKYDGGKGGRGKGGSAKEAPPPGRRGGLGGLHDSDEDYQPPPARDEKRERDKDRSRDRPKDKDRDKDKVRERDRDRTNDRPRDRDRGRSRERDRDRRGGDAVRRREPPDAEKIRNALRDAGEEQKAIRNECTSNFKASVQTKASDVLKEEIKSYGEFVMKTIEAEGVNLRSRLTDRIQKIVEEEAEVSNAA